MGQRLSTEEPPSQLKTLIPSYSPAWSLVYNDTLENWQNVAGLYRFSDYPYGCTNRDCDRDAICLKVAKALHKKGAKSVEIQRYKQSTCVISYAGDQELCSKMTQGFSLSEMVAAIQGSLAILIFYRWEKLQYDAIFVLIDLKTKVVLGHFESPTINMSIMECKISPDNSKIAILFYFREDNASPFQYDLYIFSTKTCKVLDIIRCNTEVRPYVTFDPRYKSSRVAIVNFRVDGKDGLVLYCLEMKQVIATSHVMLSIIYGGGYFCANFSKDGHFLILQKISESLHGHCYADSYIFNADNLKLLRHYYANLQRFSTFCDSNYAPLFSNCGSRMCILSEEVVQDEKKLHISVYQLPRPVSLQEQCRITILQCLADPEHVKKLPLPRSIKSFLSFTPQL
ncbi:hypothetical protein LSH36_92g05004 [Paralvinella palmiformis]|uniref:SOCS box domain-containing protein n=1 Tax=Paralvinella palmiformis TaxID=53620 RepID=A0AAD9NAC7_9ANNE|nr:hypothetical protein LSH36_92g05004 [Paralvinella palmiformis]